MQKYKFKRYKGYYKEILTLATPIIVSQMGNVLVQFVDNAMVGRLGALPLAAVSLGGTVFIFIFIVAIGLTMGITPLVGERHVQGHHRENSGYLQNAFLLYMALGVLLFAVQYSIIPLMYRLGQPTEVVDLAIPYYKYMVWSVLPFMAFAAMKQFLEGLGKTKVAMYIIITANLINVFFNWVFIYGNLGAPEMGAAGAGLASLISRLGMPLMMFVYFIRNGSINKYFKFFSKAAFSVRQMWSLLKMGFPISSQMFMECSAFCISAVMVGWIGAIEIASNQVALSVANLTFMMVLGVAAASTIRISHEFGAGNLRRLKLTANASYHVAIGYNILTAILIIVLRKWLVMIITPDPEVIEIASQLLIFVALFQISDGIQAISIGVLRGMQDVKSIMKIAFISYIVINVPIGYICAFVFGWGTMGIWIGLIVGLTIAAIQLTMRFQSHYSQLQKVSRAK